MIYKIKDMKSIVLILLFVFFSNLSYAQVLKLYNGLSVSSNKNELGLLANKYYGYYGAIGIDYLLHDYYYLSSQLGYLGKGGKDHIFVSGSDTYYDFKTKWNYIHMNTTFRLKTQTEYFYPYLGIGPKLDILISSRNIKTKEGYDLKLNPVSVGGIIELGVVKKIKKMELGLNASYSLNFNNIGDSKNGDLDTYSYKISGHTFLITLSLGCFLWGN